MDPEPPLYSTTLPDDLFQALKIAHPKISECARDKYEFPPFLPKIYWDSLGDKVSKSEKPTLVSVPGEKYISLRLDGHGFSNLTRKLKKDGILEDGFSLVLVSWMQTCCLSLMEFIGAKYGYTQSDEMTLIIPPAPVTVKGDKHTQLSHMFNGRIQKLCSLAASHVTLIFNQQLSKVTPKWQDYICTFDCRIGCFDTFQDAMSLILWRAYDSGINGIADACFHQRGKIEGAKNAVQLPTDQKLYFLAKNNLLPLQEHQEKGTYYVRVKRSKAAINPSTGENVVCLRSVIEHVHGNVISLAAKDMLTPKDDEK